MRLWMSDKQAAVCLLTLILMLLLLPLRWLCAAIIAAAIHELGHYVAVRTLGGRIDSLRFGASGAVMEATGLVNWSELVGVAAGPLAGLLLAMTFRWFPVIAICAMVQTIYNLLPISPLDGGRILRCIVFMLGGTERFCQKVECAVLMTLLLLCVYIHLRFGVAIFLFPILLILRKIPCKRRKDWI